MLRTTIQIAARCVRALNQVSRPIEGIASRVPGALRGLPGTPQPPRLRSGGGAFGAPMRMVRQATALSLTLLACSFVAGAGAYVLTQGGGALIASVSTVDIDDPGTRAQVQALWRAESPAPKRVTSKASPVPMSGVPDDSFAALLAGTAPSPEGDAALAATAPEASTDGPVGQQAQELAVVPPPPEVAGGQQVSATVSFYYCQHDTGSAGDGGGFCGAMRDGTVVRSGAAACDAAYLGQQFRIVGDPTGRVYQCSDTGSAVHGMHRDIWFATSTEGWAWLDAVGRNVTLEVLP
ncbi:MAG: hypothetical protein GEU80_16625 [Dehalococcoidia bacterium]|nr:hypothetical protein [Dehalococcoidia bacterium]